MFGSKTDKTDKSDVQVPVLMATVPMLPGRTYEVVGLVSSAERAFSGNVKVEDRLHDLEEQARKMGADGVIGIQLATSIASGNQMITTLLGTAIKFTS